jgi:hypothetical protein
MNLRYRVPSPLALLRIAALLLAIGLLSACEETRFEALPSGEVSDCDPSWVGGWQVENPSENESKDEGPVYWVVAENCAHYQTLEPGGASDGGEDFTIRYVQHGSNAYVALNEPEAKQEDSDFDKATMLVRYEFRSKNEIRTFEVDNRFVARLIVDGEISGSTEVKNSNPESTGKSVKTDSITNLIYGPSTNTDKVIKRKGVFKRKPWMILRRAGDEEIARVRAAIEERRPEDG